MTDLIGLLGGEGLDPMTARFGMYLVLFAILLSGFGWMAQWMLRPSFRRMRRYFRHRRR